MKYKPLLYLATEAWTLIALHQLSYLDQCGHLATTLKNKFLKKKKKKTSLIVGGHVENKLLVKIVFTIIFLGNLFKGKMR